MEDKTSHPLVQKTLIDFANETASESPAPGGGSISAYVGALGVSLGTMVANLSSHKVGWDDKIEYFSQKAEEGQKLKDKLIDLVDADTHAFNKIMDALKMPKATEEDKAARKAAMHTATIGAIEVPLKVMRVSLESAEQSGLQSSCSPHSAPTCCSRFMPGPTPADASTR